MANIDWLGHATFLLQVEGKVIYIDPWKLKHNEPKADLILISHSHYDHLSEPDVTRISTRSTKIICARDCAPQLGGFKVRMAAPDETIQVNGITVHTTRAYNINKKFHPRANEWLGFLITAGNETIYYSGDTDVIPEMGELGPVDVALLPVGGTYTMTAEEAAEAVKRIKPGKVIPYHWGDIVGSVDDAQRFKELSPAPVQVLPKR